MPSSSDRSQVVVWGGGTGGVAAALQAARSGAETLLLTPGPWLGGMVSAAGVCAPDGNELTPWQTGLWGAFLRELQRREPDGLDHNWVSCFGYRPATAEQLLRDWCRNEPLLRWWPDVTLQGIDRQGSRLRAIELERDGERCRVALDVLVDGSDRGDCLPFAETPYRLGWEAQETWGEPSAPEAQRLGSDPFFQEQLVQSPTWVVMGQLRDDCPGHGQSDAQQSPLLASPFSQCCQSFGLERTLTYGRLPGGLVMLNWPLQGNDWHHGLTRAFDSDPVAQAQLAGEMQAHSLDFAAALEQASEGWLKLGDAFPERETPHSRSVALMPYWREGRRLEGRDVVIEQQLLPLGPGAQRAALPLDGTGQLQSIAVGNYANDHHYPGPDWPLAAKSCRWGGRWTGTPFCIPFGSLVSAGTDNLVMADKAFSTSHMANGATRLQPLILNIGQAAGAAAALSIRMGRAVNDLPVRSIQDALIHDPVAPAAVAPLWDTPWHHQQWRERQQAVLDAPDRLLADGSLAEASAHLRVDRGPSEPGEELLRGELVPQADGTFTLRTATQCWPLITLEPALHNWLLGLEGPKAVELIGCRNPWGPWLRASRLAR